MPLRSTNRIPVRQARSDTRGRPPCGFGIEAGRSGRIKLHSASGTSAAAITIPPSREGQTLGLYRGRFCYRHLIWIDSAPVDGLVRFFQFFQELVVVAPYISPLIRSQPI